MGKEITELFRGTGNLLLTYTPLQESLESNSDGHLLSSPVQEAQEASTLEDSK